MVFSLENGGSLAPVKNQFDRKNCGAVITGNGTYTITDNGDTKISDNFNSVFLYMNPDEYLNSMIKIVNVKSLTEGDSVLISGIIFEKAIEIISNNAVKKTIMKLDQYCRPLKGNCSIIIKGEKYKNTLAVYADNGKSVIDYITRTDILNITPIYSQSIEGRLIYPRKGLSAALIGNNIYVIGGNSDNPASKNTIEKYSITEKKSVIVSGNLIPRYFGSAKSYREKIYIFGGVNSTGNVESIIDAVEEFNPADNTVKIVSKMPTPRRIPATVEYKGRIFVIGGKIKNSENRVNTVEIYDIEKNSWSKGREMPTPRECATALVDNKIYAIGGFNGQEPLNKFEVYDIESGKWEKLPDIPVKISAHHCVVYNNKIYAFGDYYDPGRIAYYDLKEKKWVFLRVQFNPTNHNEVLLYKDIIYVIGGGYNNFYVNDFIQRFDGREFK